MKKNLNENAGTGIIYNTGNNNIGAYILTSTNYRNKSGHLGKVTLCRITFGSHQVPINSNTALFISFTIA